MMKSLKEEVEIGKIDKYMSNYRFKGNRGTFVVLTTLKLSILTKRLEAIHSMNIGIKEGLVKQLFPNLLLCKTSENNVDIFNMYSNNPEKENRIRVSGKICALAQLSRESLSIAVHDGESTNYQLEVWDIKSGVQLISKKTGVINSMFYYPKLKCLLTHSQHELHLWSEEDLTQIFKINFCSGFDHCYKYGESWLVGSVGTQIRLYDVQERTFLTTRALCGGEDSINVMRKISNTNYLVAGASYGTYLRLFDLHSERRLTFIKLKTSSSHGISDLLPLTTKSILAAISSDVLLVDMQRPPKVLKTYAWKDKSKIIAFQLILSARSFNQFNQ